LDLFDKCSRICERAQETRRLGLYPYFQPITESLTEEVVIDGRRLIMIGSNNYLGLTHHPRVTSAALEAVRKYGSGCTGSRFLNGTLDLHVELERRLARFTGKEACVTFSTGFQVNLGVISTLVGKGDVVLCDRENHASIFDGCRLAFGRLLKYRHNDMDDLERQLQQVPDDAGRLIVTDGVFSMKGDLADLPGLVRVARKYGARIMVDDAHGVGVLGAHGRGTAEHFGVEDRVDLIMGTFSKSLASVGGFIAGEARVIDFVKHRARSLIFSAAPPPASVASVLKAVEIIEREPERRARLWENTRFMAEGLRGLGFDTGDSQTPVIPVVAGEDRLAFVLARRLQEEAVFVNPVVAPAVPSGRALLRTSYMATHTREHLERALAAFAKVGREVGLIR
jgi:8-amino-7-oxononanoate synthase